MLGLHALKVGLASEARSMGPPFGHGTNRELGARWPIEDEDDDDDHDYEHEHDWGGASAYR
jgi:hypothetical protein